MGANGRFTSEGIDALCEGLKGSSVTSLRCVQTTASPQLHASRRTMSSPHEHTCTFPALGSLASNELTNRGKDMSGVLKLAEALPKSQIRELRCAAARTPLCPFIAQ